MNLRKILSIAIAVCMITVQMAVCAFAEEIPAETIPTETVEETVQQEEAKTETEEAKAPADIVLTAELDDVIVTLKATADAFENKGELSLVVKPVEIEDTEEEAALDAIEKENVAKRVTYDITVLDDETEIEPVKEVKVSFELKDAPSGADKANIYHHDEEKGIEKIASEVLTDSSKAESTIINKIENNDEGPTDEELEALDDVAIINDVTVDGFSLYTVDFTYKDKTISIAGDSTGNKLDDIVSQLGITEKVEEATTYQDAECTKEVASGEVKNNAGDTLFSVYESGDSWYVDAVNAFQTEHGLVVKTADGAEYKIKVTDDPADYLNVTGYEGVYDGENHGGTVSTNLEGATIEYSTDGGSNYSTTAPQRKDASETEVKVKATKTDKTVLEKTYTIKIYRRSVTLTSGSAEKIYDGTALTNKNVTVSGDGFVGTEGLDYSNFASQTEVGSSENEFDYTFKVGTDVGNYIIKKEKGTLTVRNCIVTFNMQGHGTQVDPQSVKKGELANKPTDPTAPDYKFEGWYTEAGCTNKYDFNTPVTDDLDLFAKWTGGPTPTPTPAPSQQRSSSSTGTWSSTPVKYGSSTAPISNGSWKLVNGSFQYKVDGDSLKNSTAWISYTGTDGKPYSGCFYFDTNGMMATGWKKIDGTWFYFDPTEGQKKGMMKTTGWVNYDGKQYFLGADGKMLVNTTTPDGKKVDAEGALVK